MSTISMKWTLTINRLLWYIFVSAVFTDTQALCRELVAIQILRPLKTKFIHKILTATPCLNTQQSTWWNWLFEHCAYRRIHRAQKEL